MKSVVLVFKKVDDDLSIFGCSLEDLLVMDQSHPFIKELLSVDGLGVSTPRYSFA